MARMEGRARLRLLKLSGRTHGAAAFALLFARRWETREAFRAGRRERLFEVLSLPSQRERILA
ncbi:MAG TPA: hypothetical protein VF791_03820 [Pyrinomonadaceae bacterium]